MSSRFLYCQLSRCLLLFLFLLVLTVSSRDYCDMCELLMEDTKEIVGKNLSYVSELSLMTTTSSLCGKYFVGFEEVICRILCQVNAGDLLKALQQGVPNHLICQKGGVCNDGFR